MPGFFGGATSGGGGSVDVSALNKEATQLLVASDIDWRFGGGKLAITAQVTLSGDTTVHTPAAGKKIRLFWISALNDPDAAQSPRIIVKFGTSELYRAYAVAHWEVFDGAVDQPLVVNLDQTGDVAVTAHYVEV